MGKPKIIKDYEKLDVREQEQIKIKYPFGFEDHLIKFTDKNGRERLALPFETDAYYYLLRMTMEEARQFIIDDDDYDTNGTLKDDVLEELQNIHLDNNEELNL